jgi:hypothetical protein
MTCITDPTTRPQPSSDSERRCPGRFQSKHIRTANAAATAKWVSIDASGSRSTNAVLHGA